MLPSFVTLVVFLVWSLSGLGHDILDSWEDLSGWIHDFAQETAELVRFERARSLECRGYEAFDIT